MLLHYGLSTMQTVTNTEAPLHCVQHILLPWLLSITCLWRAYLAKQGLHVPKGRTCHLYKPDSSSFLIALHRGRSRGLSSCSKWIRWKIALISPLMATVCSLQRWRTPSSKGPRTGQGSNWLLSVSPLYWYEQLNKSLALPLWWTTWNHDLLEKSTFWQKMVPLPSSVSALPHSRSPPVSYLYSTAVLTMPSWVPGSQYCPCDGGGAWILVTPSTAMLVGYCSRTSSTFWSSLECVSVFTFVYGSISTFHTVPHVEKDPSLGKQ